MLYPTPARTTARHRWRPGEGRVGHPLDVVEQEDRVGLGQVRGQGLLVMGPGHDHPGHAFHDRAFDGGVLEEVGDQHVHGEGLGISMFAGALVIADPAGRFNDRGARRIRRDPPGNPTRQDPPMPKIKQLLADGKLVRMFGIGQLFTPKLVEVVGEQGGFDALWIDAEHAGLGMKEIELATMAARYYGLDHFVRQPATDYASIMRSLEAGAGGVMISMVRSPEEAEEAVRWAKFHPGGSAG